MGLLLIAFILPVIFYLLAHQMPNKKWLTAYSFFWLTLIAFAIYDLIAVTNLPSGDDDLSLGWVMVAGFIYFSCTVAIIGIVGRAIVLYQRHQNKDIKMSTVHLSSFCTLIILPNLIQLLMLLIGLIYMSPMLLRIFILKIEEIAISLLSAF